MRAPSLAWKERKSSPSAEYTPSKVAVIDSFSRSERTSRSPFAEVPAPEGANPLLRMPPLALLVPPSFMPLVSVVNSMKLRPLRGRLTIFRSGITPPTTGASVSISGVVAATSTVWVISPTCSARSIRACWFT